MEYMISILIFFPLLGGVVAAFLHDRVAKLFGLIVAIIELVFVCALWCGFDLGQGGMQFEQIFALIPAFGISYHVGIDGMALVLVLLSAIITLLSVAFLHERFAHRHFIACVLILESILMGVFSAQNVVLFYVFWELSLLPILYMIAIYGSGERLKSALVFFLYTFFASLIMLLGILYYGFLFFLQHGRFSFELADWLSMPLPESYQMWLFLAFFFAIAVKIPIIPFHAWLPRTYGDAPTIGSVLLSALLLKMGTYALVRFCVPLFPDASVESSSWILLLGLIMIIYGALLAYAQRDMKQVIAYSSLSHMGVVVLGVFSFTLVGLSGAVFMMFAHGIVGAALFMLVGSIEERVDSREIGAMCGVARVAPVFSAVFALVMMANVGLPLSIGFVGEFLSLLGIFASHPIIALLGGLTIILSAAYMLHLYRKLFLGVKSPESNPHARQNPAHFSDLDLRERVVFGIFGVLIIVLGVYPRPILAPIEPSAKAALELAATRAQGQSAKLALQANLAESKQSAESARLDSAILDSTRRLESSAAESRVLDSGRLDSATTAPNARTHNSHAGEER